MSLKITLRPNERIIIDGAVVTNGHAKSVLIIENNVTILRQKDILNEKEANTPARRIYFVVQLMYIDKENLAFHHKNYWKLVQDYIAASPSGLSLIDQISDKILKNQFYQALKLSRKLIDYEQEVISSARASA